MFSKNQNMDADMDMPQKRSGKKGLVVWIVILVVLFVAWRALAMFGVLPMGNFPPVNSNEWQAVFLNNNQVYFGHLKGYSDNFVVLSNIYYLRAAEPLQQGAANPSLNLVKLGSELHGPQDTMYIPQSQIMFWENLKTDSPIVSAIKNFLAQQK